MNRKMKNLYDDGINNYFFIYENKLINLHAALLNRGGKVNPALLENTNFIFIVKHFTNTYHKKLYLEIIEMSKKWTKNSY